MTAKAEQLLDEALSLSPDERAQLAEKLFSSLDIPQQKLDHLWAKEADNRIEAFEQGALKAIPAHKVFKNIISHKKATNER